MTAENQKRLYEHFKETGQEDRAQEILKAYPEFEEAKTEKPKKS